MKPPKGRGQALMYLDFDGVLMHEGVYWHPRRGAYLQAPARYSLFQHSALLEQMLVPHPGIRIVLSTSWVLRYSCAGAAKRLPAGLRARVIGATFHSGMSRDAFRLLPRGEQVTQDVLRRRPGSWLALDDDQIGWPAWSLPNVVFTDPYEGISPKHLQSDVRRMLALLEGMQLPSVLPNPPQP